MGPPVRLVASLLASIASALPLAESTLPCDSCDSCCRHWGQNRGLLVRFASGTMLPPDRFAGASPGDLGGAALCYCVACAPCGAEWCPASKGAACDSSRVPPDCTCTAGCAGDQEGEKGQLGEETDGCRAPGCYGPCSFYDGEMDDAAAANLAFAAQCGFVGGPGRLCATRRMGEKNKEEEEEGEDASGHESEDEAEMSMVFRGEQEPEKNSDEDMGEAEGGGHAEERVGLARPT